MEDSDILQHLLEIEEQAATLVDDAQAEAVRRLKEAEEQNRLIFDEAYRKLMAELEAKYQKSFDFAKTEYSKLLDEFRENLNRISKNNVGFSALAFSLLTEKK